MQNLDGVNDRWIQIINITASHEPGNSHFLRNLCNCLCKICCNNEQETQSHTFQCVASRDSTNRNRVVPYRPRPTDLSQQKEYYVVSLRRERDQFRVHPVLAGSVRNWKSSHREMHSQYSSLQNFAEWEIPDSPFCCLCTEWLSALLFVFSSPSPNDVA